MEPEKYEGSERRRKPRKMTALTVKLRPGGNPQAKPIVACTLDISQEGARLNLAGWIPAPGEIVNVERGTEKSMFRIAWIGDPTTGRRGQIGIQCLEQGRSIFQDKKEEVKSDTAKIDLMKLLAAKK